MSKGLLHRWNVSPEEAVEIQNQLRAQIDLHSEPEKLETVAGIDVSYDKGSDWLFAAIVVLHVADLQLIGSASAVAQVPFPYIPGLLSFRECPAVLQAWDKLQIQPDCIMCDGQGIAHPRRLGIASHLGLWLDIPSIGCAKSLLVGAYREPGATRGSTEPLIHRKEHVGAIVRTKDRVSPVFVSPGHKITLKKAVEIVLACCTKHRLPEPTRRAHLLVNEIRRNAGKE
ncbi:MAG TPA: deoxyribonuclease V [Methylomirabilota bacterium]|jgi:deoxyribonuclease V|nr:deoxyribonuclease V [Methylomirabilota bacterium]